VSIFPPTRSYFATDPKRMRPPPLHRLLGSLGVLAVLLAAAGDGHAAPAAGPDQVVPADARLGAARDSMQAAVDRAGVAGLPTRPLIVKVREGLAKGVPPERIAAAVESLARGLEDANQFARAHGRGASPALLTALADLHARGVALQSAAPLVTAHADEPALLRAIDVLGELAARGYPEGPAGQLLRNVEERDPAAIGRVASGLETIRRGLTVSRADALDALGANLSLDGTALDAAVNKSLEGKEHGAAAGNGHGNGQGSDHAAAASKKGMGKGLLK